MFSFHLLHGYAETGKHGKHGQTSVHTMENEPLRAEKNHRYNNSLALVITDRYIYQEPNLDGRKHHTRKKKTHVPNELGLVTVSFGTNFPTPFYSSHLRTRVPTTKGIEITSSKIPRGI